MRKKTLPPYKEPAEKCIGMEIRTLGNLTMRLMENKSHKEKIDDATGTNGWILRFLAEAEAEGRDIYQRDIEKKFCVTRSTVSKVLTLMEHKGMIERRNVKGDARLRKIVMTDKARELHSLMRDDVIMLENVLRGGLTENEIETFYMLSEKIKNNLKKALEI
ncbi:MAG: MarR family transcriptional regulator [Clostridia bacterium]|nr:MarR family transcriptional regulator [Clostridia bacterium]